MRLGPAIALIAALTCLALPASAQVGNARQQALDDIGRGAAAFQAGDLVAATRHWSQAIQLCRQAGAADLEAQALARRGEAYRVAGYFRDARKDLDAALDKAEQQRDQKLVAATTGALGNLAFMARRSAVAEPLLLRSRDLARRLSDLGTLAASSNDLGNLYAATARPGAAAAAYREAVSAAEGAHDGALAATAEINSARLAFAQNDRASALPLLTRAVDRLDRAPDSYGRDMALVSAGSVLFDRAGKLSAGAEAVAYRAFRTAAAAAKASHDWTLSSLAFGNLGRLYERAGRVEDARRLTEQALFAAQRASSPDLRFRWEWQEGRLDRAQGRIDAAIASYREAVADLQSIRQDIPVEYHGGVSSYRKTFGPLYLQFTALLIDRAKADPAAARPLLREARASVDRLRESELEDYFRDSCVTTFEAQQKAIESIAPGTAVLYPISLPDRIEILVSFGKEIKDYTVPVPEKRLRREVTRFRELLEKRTTNEYLVPARRLYDQIIRPIVPALTAHRVDTLVIVPDEVLRVVPFAAFFDGHEFLVDRFATAIVPSLKLVAPKPLAAGAGTALVLGISHSVQGYVPLPNVAHEVAAVHELEGGDELLNSGFTRTRFARDLKSGRYDIVHIASHGQFGDDPSRTFVLAFDGKLTMDDLESDIKYGSTRDIPLELLILSACETASGDDRAALGLAGVALKAGARSALATLWYINDKASGAMVAQFYKGLKSGLSRAQALRAAQRALAADPRFAHPAYWAPYLLIGDWL
ncbi:MAG TPA: CHAT domain-containing protein [Stellaceae bacterium]|nr:CHAT domain-containing protein [Stellaceae bacterium]